MINSYIKYIYYLLGLILLILLIIIIQRLLKVKKAFNGCTDGINNINDKIIAIKEKLQYLKQSFSTSWLFFLEIYAIIQLIKIIIKDYISTPKQKRSMIKSSTKTVVKNPNLTKMALKR